LARLGLPASDVAAATAEPAQGAEAMALVLFHRATQFAIDPGAFADRRPRARELNGFLAMDPSYVPALAALAGSAIGGLTSFASAWLNPESQERAARLPQDKGQRG